VRSRVKFLARLPQPLTTAAGPAETSLGSFTIAKPELVVERERFAWLQWSVNGAAYLEDAPAAIGRTAKKARRRTRESAASPLADTTVRLGSQLWK
jgi:hypothetical protein